MTKIYPLPEILLVEDNPAEAELAKRAFRQNKVENPILHAADGEEAMEIISSLKSGEGHNAPHRFGLILLDINIPKINGLEVLKALKTDDRTKVIPAVMLTTSDEISDIKLAYAYGANSYLVKPHDFHDFIEEVRLLSEYWLELNKTLKNN
jgi:two-component system response regulator